MQYQIDQSIRIEQTNKATIIGLADISGKHTFALVISAKIKRQIQEYHRRQGLPTIFMVNLFTAGIILILKKSSFPVHNLVIDIEYPGYETRMIKTIQDLSPHHPDVGFTVIGKHSHAHLTAYGVYLNKREPDYRATYQDIIEIIQQKDRVL